jgi:retron-type reverse transcriptase
MRDNNIFLAYRNIKKNKGSATAGYDGVTIKDIEKLACGDFLTIIKRRFKDYRPRKVKKSRDPETKRKTSTFRNSFNMGQDSPAMYSTNFRTNMRSKI